MNLGIDQLPQPYPLFPNAELRGDRYPLDARWRLITIPQLRFERDKDLVVPDAFTSLLPSVQKAVLSEVRCGTSRFYFLFSSYLRRWRSDSSILI